jgi:hypothetical protein
LRRRHWLHRLLRLRSCQPRRSSLQRSLRFLLRRWFQQLLGFLPRPACLWGRWRCFRPCQPLRRRQLFRCQESLLSCLAQVCPRRRSMAYQPLMNWCLCRGPARYRKPRKTAQRSPRE